MGTAHDTLRQDRHGLRLPPGQRVVEGFPRFGTHLHRPAPPVPHDHAIRIDRAGAEPVLLAADDLARLPRRELVADLHCVAGWSAVNLRWEGVGFDTLYRDVLRRAPAGDRPITHVVFTGLDGHSATVTVADALAGDVLIAQHLDGLPLDSDHGAPARLVSPSQYGYISVKHLSRVELRTSPPPRPPRTLADRLIEDHPRARVWEEERHGSVPGRVVRGAYRLLVPPIRRLSALGSAERVRRRERPIG